LKRQKKLHKKLGKYDKRSYHHSIIVINKEPPEAKIKQFLYELCRATGQSRNIPSNITDCILNQKLNRYISVTRSGTVSLSWPTHGSDFEITHWWKKFCGIYLLLDARVIGEKAILLELSRWSAETGALLSLLERSEIGLEELIQLRKELFELATLRTRYTIEMSSDDCGGIAEYYEYFSGLRQTFAIRSQRSELREEIHDVLAIVEHTYLEEQRKNNENQKKYLHNEKEREKEFVKLKQKGQNTFQRVIGIITIFSLPYILIGGIFGMNLTDLPQPTFLAVILLCTGISVTFVILIYLVLTRSGQSLNQFSFGRK